MNKYDKNLNPSWIRETLNKSKDKNIKNFFNKINSDKGISLNDVDNFVRNSSLAKSKRN